MLKPAGSQAEIAGSPKSRGFTLPLFPNLKVPGCQPSEYPRSSQPESDCLLPQPCKMQGAGLNTHSKTKISLIQSFQSTSRCEAVNIPSLPSIYEIASILQHAKSIGLLAFTSADCTGRHKAASKPGYTSENDTIIVHSHPASIRLSICIVPPVSSLSLDRELACLPASMGTPFLPKRFIPYVVIPSRVLTALPEMAGNRDGSRGGLDRIVKLPNRGTHP